MNDTFSYIYEDIHDTVSSILIIQFVSRSRPKEDTSAHKPPGSAMPSYRSPKKAKKHVDEWSVLTLYNDVSHFEEQKAIKMKEAQEKAKTRQTLQVCMLTCAFACVRSCVRVHFRVGALGHACSFDSMIRA